MSYNSSNIFARILRGEIACVKIFENDYVLAFKDIHPKAPYHVLVVPKGEYRNFHDFHANAPAIMIGEFYQAVRQIIEQSKLNQDGYRLITNFGENGGQEVDHYHVHILGGKAIGPLIAS
ncbi:HIT domain-containing protein [Candidatus Paracaedibacter symbiosus]|uniref:HIT domain-containing protein n=1 Tax=Candidatus Paracaedibacter symbiosus TaxID=244582 RepID=UPI000509B634